MYTHICVYAYMLAYVYMYEHTYAYLHICMCVTKKKEAINLRVGVHRKGQKKDTWQMLQEGKGMEQ